MGLLQGIKDLLSLVQRLTGQRARNRLKLLLCSRALSGRGRPRRPKRRYKNPESLSFLALGDLQDLIDLNVSQNLNPSAGPAQLNFFDSCVTAQAEMDALI